MLLILENILFSHKRTTSTLPVSANTRPIHPEYTPTRSRGAPSWSAIEARSRSYDLELDELRGDAVEQLDVLGAVRRALRPRLGGEGGREGLLQLLCRARPG